MSDPPPRPCPIHGWRREAFCAKCDPAQLAALDAKIEEAGWLAHERECESAALALLRERARPHRG